jgi:hypothetical protein
MLLDVEVIKRPRRAELSILGPQGDTTLTWDPAKPIEVETARAKYGELVKQGYTGFELAKGSQEKGELIREFNPRAERILMVPQAAGG